jgi:hypothetical protein
MVQLLSGTILVFGLVQPISITKFISGLVVSRSPAVYFMRHRPHTKPENRLLVNTVFMTDMKLIRAFSDWATVLKHLVDDGSASCFDVESVHPATSSNTALKPPPFPEARWLKHPT